MAEVTGLGGVFYKVEDPAKTKAWYQEMLGVGGEWGIMFPYSASPDGFGIVSTFDSGSGYFAPSDKPFMINLRVDDLEAFVGELQAKGIEILGRQDESYGRFAWILDCDGIKLELFEQIGGAP
jgi:catechol 2,3-dioxygenase-like lactoylglutathione lyase family enzyme